MEGKLGQPTFQQMPKERVPMVSIMVPCYNEGDNLDEAIPIYFSLDTQIMNSSLSMMVAKITRVKLLSVGQKTNALLHFIQENQGKASALNHGLLVAKGNTSLVLMAMPYWISMLSITWSNP